MAKIKGGQLILNKTEKKEIETMIEHSKKDIDYGWDGSFGGYDNKSEEKQCEADVKKVKNAIETLKFIISMC